MALHNFPPEHAPTTESAPSTFLAKIGEVANRLSTLKRNNKEKIAPTWDLTPRKTAIQKLYAEIESKFDPSATAIDGEYTQELLTDDGTLYEFRRQKQNLGTHMTITRHVDYVEAGLNNCAIGKEVFQPLTQSYTLRRTDRASGEHYQFEHQAGLGKPSPDQIDALTNEIQYTTIEDPVHTS